MGIIIEVGQFSHNDFQSLLDQVIGIMRLEAVPAQLVLEQGAVLRIEALPGCSVIRLLLQPVEEALRSLGHGH